MTQETTPASDRRLDEWLALANAATPEPWYSTQTGEVFIDTRAQVCCGKGYDECCGNPDVIGDYDKLADSNPKDAAFIAAAREAIPALIAMVRERDAWKANYENAAERLIWSAGAHGEAEARVTAAEARVAMIQDQLADAADVAHRAEERVKELEKAVERILHWIDHSDTDVLDDDEIAVIRAALGRAET